MVAARARAVHGVEAGHRVVAEVVSGVAVIGVAGRVGVVEAEVRFTLGLDAVPWIWITAEKPI